MARHRPCHQGESCSHCPPSVAGGPRWVVKELARENLGGETFFAQFAVLLGISVSILIPQELTKFFDNFFPEMREGIPPTQGNVVKYKFSNPLPGVSHPQTAARSLTVYVKKMAKKILVRRGLDLKVCDRHKTNKSMNKPG